MLAACQPQFSPYAGATPVLAQTAYRRLHGCPPPTYRGRVRQPAPGSDRWTRARLQESKREQERDARGLGRHRCLSRAASSPSIDSLTACSACSVPTEFQLEEPDTERPSSRRVSASYATQIVLVPPPSVHSNQTVQRLRATEALLSSLTRLSPMPRHSRCSGPGCSQVILVTSSVGSIV